MTKPANTGKMKLAELSPAARAAVEKRSLDGGWDVRSLVKLMAELERWDHMAEARKARAKKVFIGGITGTFFGIFAMVAAATITDHFLWGLPLYLLPLVVLILGIRMRRAARNIDLPDELRLCLKPVIRQLAQDLHPDEKIRVTMNLAGIDEKKCANTRDLPPGRNRSLRQSTYEEGLCTLRLPLVDGSEAVLRMDNTYLKLHKSYKGRSGKIKYKTKWKKLSTVTAILIPPTRINWEPARMQQHIDRNNEKMSFVEKDGVMAARLDRYYKFKAADIPSEVPPSADILRMFVRLTAMQPQSNGGAR